MSESEFAKLANEESMLPDELELPEDDTGACYTALMLCDVFYCSIFNDAAQVCECKKVVFAIYIYIICSLGRPTSMSRPAVPARPDNSH